ncbi:MAG: hypothetical protein J7M26_04420, partial [Armatimonadetes bacterium]|nr:hypothetical protein [Armatimonadota bacterium]
MAERRIADGPCRRETRLAAGWRSLVGGVALVLGLIALMPAVAQAQTVGGKASLFDEYRSLAKPYAAIEPTPMGEGHLGELKSGAFVPLRFPVPKPMPLGYALQLGNVVAFSGRGTSYKLILR